ELAGMLCRQSQGESEDSGERGGTSCGHSSVADLVGLPVGRIDRLLTDDLTFGRRVDHSPASDVDAYVSDRLKRQVGLEEDEVSRLEIGGRNPGSGVELLLSGAGKPHSELPVRPLHQARAVKTGGRARTAPHVGPAELR